jgi:hypothetical protein
VVGFGKYFKFLTLFPSANHLNLNKKTWQI